jgi:hypothetical protein
MSVRYVRGHCPRAARPGAGKDIALKNSNLLAALAVALMMNGVILGSVAYVFNAQAERDASSISSDTYRASVYVNGGIHFRVSSGRPIIEAWPRKSSRSRILSCSSAVFG